MSKYCVRVFNPEDKAGVINRLNFIYKPFNVRIDPESNPIIFWVQLPDQKELNIMHAKGLIEDYIVASG